MSRASSEDLVELAAHWAGQAERDEALEVAVGRSRSTTVRAYGGQVESFTSAESMGVGIRVLRRHGDGATQGFAHAGSFDPDVVADALVEARDNAAFAEADPWAGLAEPDGVLPVVFDLWNEALLGVSPEQKIALALELERATTAAHPAVKGVRVAVYGDAAGESALASSTGMRSSGRATTCSLSVSCLADDDGATHMGYGSAAGRHLDDLDVDVVAADAAGRAARLLGARQAPSQRLAMVLEPRLAATLLSIVAGTLCADAVVKGRSLFAGRTGEAVASPLLTLCDDPTDARSLGADSHDGEGLACRPNTLLDAGVLQGFLHNSYTGRRMGTTSTASAVRSARSLPGVGPQALAMAPGDRPFAHHVAAVDRGILVQAMTGIHSGVNPVSGDFSVGIEGMMIRNGAEAEPVREVTVASTLPRLLLGITAVGAETEFLPSGAAMSGFVVGEVSLSGS